MNECVLGTCRKIWYKITKMSLPNHYGRVYIGQH